MIKPCPRRQIGSLHNYHHPEVEYHVIDPSQETHLPEISVTFWISHSFMCQRLKNISSVSFPCPGNSVNLPISLFPCQEKHLFVRNTSIYYQSHSELVLSSSRIRFIISTADFSIAWLEITLHSSEPQLWEVSKRKKKLTLFFGRRYIQLLVWSCKITSLGSILKERIFLCLNDKVMPTSGFFFFSPFWNWS